MRVSLFDYKLPTELIAQQPLAERAGSRMLVLDRSSEQIQHRRFTDLRDYLVPGDCLVINQTRVIPARLLGRRSTGGQVAIVDRAARQWPLGGAGSAGGATECGGED